MYGPTDTGTYPDSTSLLPFSVNFPQSCPRAYRASVDLSLI